MKKSNYGKWKKYVAWKLGVLDLICIVKVRLLNEESKILQIVEERRGQSIPRTQRDGSE